MSLFVLDSAGDKELLTVEKHSGATVGNAKHWNILEDNVRTTLSEATKNLDFLPEEFEDKNDEDYFGLPPPDFDITDIVREENEVETLKEKKSKLELDLEICTKLVDAVLQSNPKKTRKGNIRDFDESTGKLVDEDELGNTDIAKELKSSRLVEDFGRLKELPCRTVKQQRKLNRIERSKSKGPGWYNLPATEKTEEAKNELKILQMRSVLDPKHFYKKNDLKVLPKYFQIGTVQHSPLDYYNERGTRHKKKSLVDDLLENEVAQSYTKRKFKEVVARREKYAHRKAMQKVKRLKKK